MRAKDHRLGIPLGVKLKATLLFAGFSEEQIEAGVQFDHCPALGRRSLDENGEITPASNDYRYIRPMTKPDHDIKTRGRGATTAGSDIGEIAKTKRIEKDPAGGAAFRRKLLAAKAGLDEPAAPAKRKFKKAWPARPFQSQRKKT